MAKLTIKIANTGEEFEIEDVDLKQNTPRLLIDEMIIHGLLPHETIAPYGIIDKNGVKVEGDGLCLSFAELGFVDGDTIRIIARASGCGGGSSHNPNNSISDYTYESKPHVYSLEERVHLIAEEKVAMLQLEQLRHEENRCRSHIDKLRYGLKEQKKIETYCMKRRDVLPSAEIHISAFRRLEAIDKMQDLLNNRLAQLQNTTSFFGRLRGANELAMIKELLML